MFKYLITLLQKWDVTDTHLIFPVEKGSPGVQISAIRANEAAQAELAEAAAAWELARTRAQLAKAIAREEAASLLASSAGIQTRSSVRKGLEGTGPSKTHGKRTRSSQRK